MTDKKREFLSNMRAERDSLGVVRVPQDALWGPQTQRAVENFPISGQRFGRRFIAALGSVKQACAQANVALGLLDPERGDAILKASDEVIRGGVDAHFPIDISCDPCCQASVQGS